ncbi:alcohol dehydrogenase catalytic domain-containing protein [Paraburkholderia sp. BL25I1N1]|uniref:alcohol dehydrogenase catalytic domain-containing protein n=1 Tax=Paraburkholderia sp. BL25I1N1 TaxID=1938804 RepID=UPI000D05D9A4|nr:alcohol dehydrogenase catalytic domain-containing protein [Paraburkholderia sp. BL25I1N1]PRY05951.1 alcohol dehydrogenase [Paraburkholderia sp. BL25I1N1]
MEKMRAARLHQIGNPMEIDEIPVPTPEVDQVLVRVEACGVVPNLGNVIKNYPIWFPDLPLPALPAIFGLDPAGVVVAVGKRVFDFKEGDRVYVNPGRACGACRSCRANDALSCERFAFSGYFGFSAQANELLRHYPYGGFAEYMTAPQQSLVRLPDSVTFDQAARFGYLGTAYAALARVNAGPGQTVIINGATGTLGLGAVLLALARGTTKILAVARDMRLLQRVEELSPRRVEIFSTTSGQSLADWAAACTGGKGVDAVVDTLGPGTPSKAVTDALDCLRRGAKAVNVGGVSELVPMNLFKLMAAQIQWNGSNWFSAAQGQDMADMAACGLLDLSVFETTAFPLDRVNDALSTIGGRNGGFTNFVVKPQH